MYGAVLAIAVGVLYLAQLVLVPLIASSKGKDTGIWFLVTVVWMVAVGWLSLLGPLAVAGVDTVPPEKMPVFVVGAAICVGFGCLPLVAITLARGKKRDDYYARRMRRRRRIP